MNPRGSEGRRKAYYVERVTRGVTLVLVYADNAEDAKRRYVQGDYERVIDTEHEGRGFGKVRRAPDEDRDA
jgi:hypothetical protein